MRVGEGSIQVCNCPRNSCIRIGKGSIQVCNCPGNSRMRVGEGSVSGQQLPRHSRRQVPLFFFPCVEANHLWATCGPTHLVSHMTLSIGLPCSTRTS